MHNTKKGQIVGQIFIYIMVVIVVGVIMLFGYNGIQNILEKKCQVEQLQFKTDIENMIGKYNGFGSVEIKTITTPCDYDEVCFVSVDADNTGLSSTFDCSNKIIENAYDENVKQNIFVVSKGRTFPIGYSNLLTTNKTQECTCVKQKNGNFYLTFIGQGSRTNVTTQ